MLIYITLKKKRTRIVLNKPPNATKNNIEKQKIQHPQTGKNTIIKKEEYNMALSENIMVSKNGFVFDASTGDSFLCNAIGIEIINMLKTNKNEKEIKDALLTDYIVSEYELDRDVDDFFSMLRRFNLLW